MRQHASTSTQSIMSTFKVGLAAGLLLGAALLAMPVRAEDVSLEGQIANSRLVGEISTALSSYSHRVDSLAQNLSPDARTRTETQAFDDYRRLVWYVSALESSATEAEADEYGAIQEMVVVYNEMHNRVATTARAGDLVGAARQAEVAGGVADEIKAGLQLIANRNYTGLFQTAATFSATRSAAIAMPTASRVAAAE